MELEWVPTLRASISNYRQESVLKPYSMDSLKASCMTNPPQQLCNDWKREPLEYCLL